MSYIQEHEMEEHVRSDRRQLKSELATLAQGDQRHKRMEERVRENTILIRQLIVDRGMDVCSEPECVEEGTVTRNGKQYCELHS
jgi:hypothetical protein